MEARIKPGEARSGDPPPRPGPPCARCITLNRPGARFCDNCGAPLAESPHSRGSVRQTGTVRLRASMALPSHTVPPAPAPRQVFVPYPVPARDGRREGGAFGTGFGMSLGWFAGQVVFRAFTLAILVIVAIALFGPAIAAVGAW